MTRDKTPQAPHPTDPATDEILEVETDPADPGADTEGHSLLTIELARALSTERAREVERLGREGARRREAQPTREGGLLRRIRRS